MRGSTKASRNFDPTIYPVEEKVGEDILQRWIAELLRPLLDRWFRKRGVRALVGADQFIYYGQHEPTLRVAPDIYVLPGIQPDVRVTSWKTWENGIVPSFVLEIVSKDWRKDYEEALQRYEAIGVQEVVIFDPEPDRHAEGVAWQVFRSVGGRPLRRVDASQGDRVRSRTLGCFLRAVGSGDALRLRVGTGPRGDDLFPTAEEAERAAKDLERAAKDAAIVARDVERAAKDAAVVARDAALRRVLELETKLRRRRSKSR